MYAGIGVDYYTPGTQYSVIFFYDDTTQSIRWKHTITYTIPTITSVVSLGFSYDYSKVLVGTSN